jgi:hypothetical protein
MFDDVILAIKKGLGKAAGAGRIYMQNEGVNQRRQDGWVPQ